MQLEWVTVAVAQDHLFNPILSDGSHHESRYGSGKQLRPSSALLFSLFTATVLSSLWSQINLFSGRNSALSMRLIAFPTAEKGLRERYRRDMANVDIFYEEYNKEVGVFDELVTRFRNSFSVEDGTNKQQLIVEIESKYKR